MASRQPGHHADDFSGQAQAKRDEIQNKASETAHAAQHKASQASQAAQNKAGDASSTAQDIKDQASHLLQQACMKLLSPTSIFLYHISVNVISIHLVLCNAT
ncbi:hypothetical protein ACLB2K_055480 [Fragaria x ananassa]